MEGLNHSDIQIPFSPIESDKNKNLLSSDQLGKLQEQKECNIKHNNILSQCNRFHLALNLPGPINSTISDNIINTHHEQQGQLPQSAEVDINTAQNFVEALNKNNNEALEQINNQDNKSLEDIGKLIQDYEKETNYKSKETMTYVEIGTGYQRSHIKNKNTSFTIDNSVEYTNQKGERWSSKNPDKDELNERHLKDTEFVSQHMQNIESMIQSSDGSFQSFIEQIEQGGFNEDELLKNMAALSVLSYIRAYNNEFLAISETGSLKEKENAAEAVLNQEINADQMIQDLQTSIKTGEHINSVTCIQYASVIAQALKKFGYEVNTATIDNGIQHRFTTVKGNDGMTHIISDGQIFTGKNYKQAYSNYLAKEASMTFRSDVFDENNNHEGSVATETMTDIGNTVSANDSLDIQKLTEQISDQGVDDKNKRILKITNNEQTFQYNNYSIDGNGFNVGLSRKEIINEGTTVSSGEIGLSQLFDTFENGKVKTAQQISFGKVDFQNGNSTTVYGLSNEVTAYQGFNMNEYGEVIDNGTYGNLSGAAAINVLGRGGSEYSSPVSNVDITASFSGKIGYKNDIIDIYLKGGTSGELKTLASTEATQNFQETDTLGKYLGIGIKGDGITNNGSYSIEHVQGEYRGLHSKTTSVAFETQDFQLTAKHVQELHKNPLIENEKTLNLGAGYKLGNVSALGGEVQNAILKVEYEKNTIGVDTNTDQIKATISFNF